MFETFYNYFSNLSVKTILGYIFTIFGYLFYYICCFVKRKSTRMIFNSLSSLAFIVSFFFFGSYNGIAASVIIVLRGPCIIYKDKSKKNMHWLFVLFVLASLTSAIIFWQGPASIFITICVCINLVANWYFEQQNLRLASALASAFYIVFFILIGNYIAIILESTVIMSNILSFIKYKKR